MKTLLFVLSIFCSFFFGTVLFVKAMRGHELTPLDLARASGSITAVVTHLLGVW